MPKLDIAKRNVTFLCHYEVLYPEATDISYARDVYGILWETNVVAASDRVTKFIAMVMGNDAPDIFQFDYFYPSFMSRSYVTPWNEYIDFDIALWRDQKANLDLVSYKDNYYYIGAGFARWENMVFYNKELFEEYGVKTPLEYYNEGSWTWDTFRDLAIQMNIDSTGSGIPEVWGCGIDQINMFVYTTGLEMVTYNPKDGTATNNLRSAELARAIEFTASMRGSNFCYDGSDGGPAFGNGNVAILCAPMWYRTFMTDLLDRDAVGIVPPPRDPATDKYYTYQSVGGLYLASGAPNPIGAAAFACAQRYQYLDEECIQQSREKTAATANWSLEMQDMYERLFNDPGKTPVLDTWVSFNMGEFWGDFWMRPILGEPWSVIAEELYPMVEEKIATALNG